MKKRKKIAGKFPEVREAQRTQPSVFRVVLSHSSSQVYREVLCVQLSHAGDRVENKEDATEENWTINVQDARILLICFFLSTSSSAFYWLLKK